jgi:hypothetical protein
MLQLFFKTDHLPFEIYFEIYKASAPTVATHFRSADTAARALGTRIAWHTFTHALRPTRPGWHDFGSHDRLRLRE